MSKTKSELPEGYETFFNQVTGKWSLWYKEKGATRPDLMADDFITKKEAIDFLMLK